MEKRGVVTLHQDDELFPKDLLHCTKPPHLLYALGNIKLLSQTASCIAIVGTRKPTGYGLQITRLFAEKLASAGMTIVSGMAYGIDAAAHTACIEAGGKTIAVLGGGVDVIYPRANIKIYDDILKNDGLILSEQPPGQEPLKGMFVLRNRIISGLSRGTMVVEGTIKSGSMITARYAADQGKDVFVAPMPLTSILSEGPLSLFRNGARMVTGPDEILIEYRFADEQVFEKKIYQTSNEEKKVLELLAGKDLSIDSLSKITGVSIPDLSYSLTSLELKGYIMKTLSGTYQRIS